MATSKFKSSNLHTCPIQRSSRHGFIYEFSVVEFLHFLCSINAPNSNDFKNPCKFIPMTDIKSILKSIKGVLK